MELRQYKDTPYYISPNGDVYRKLKSGKFSKRKTYLKQDGYCANVLHYNNTRTDVKNHHLVAHCYISERPSKNYEIDHIDQNRSNNHYTNLRWVTHAENMRYKCKNKRHIFGQKVHTNKLTESDVLKIRSEKGKKTLTELSKEYNVTLQNIFRIHNNISWKHLI